jgi:gliding motility-associated-like protein/uncharacterized repeat protein (TIGR01451 family)
MPKRFRYILLSGVMLFSILNAAAQLSMPDSVYTGTAKHYYVDPDPVPGSTYTWKINGVTQVGSVTNEIDITWNAAGAFSVEVRELSANGCFGPVQSGQVFVSAGPLPADSADLSIEKSVTNSYPIVGHTVIFNIVATNNGPDMATGVSVTDILPAGYTYVSATTTTGTYNSLTGIWTINDMNNGAAESITITATVNATGDYVNTATLNGNETDGVSINNVSSAETFPTDFFIPGGFSPNGDGINDLFVIRGILNYPDNTIVIFNRWGAKVYETNHYQNTWDGRSNKGLSVGGDLLPTGTYFYLLDLGDDSGVIKGTVYLNR